MSWHPEKPGVSQKIKNIVIGPEVDLKDRSIFRRLSIIAFFAWIGLGADGLSSSCYGPAEAFAALGQHHFLAILIGLGTVVTICTISISYSQVIELFPQGGGGYLVATELLSPRLGMISGCALIIDYALTITLSIASGADAIFSMLPQHWATFKIPLALGIILLMTILNLRGVKESIQALTPVFMLFVITHAFVIVYAIIRHASEAPDVVSRIGADISAGHAELGTVGLIILMFRAYSLGAGTYTGLEAVSNGLPILKEPKVETGKRTMVYMAVSLSVTVMGLMLAYVLYAVKFQPGKTLNAALFEAVTLSWPDPWGYIFVLLALSSEAMILFVAAQTGFLGGPRVVANMALDRWLPSRFAILSDRLVMQNGTIYFALISIVLMVLFDGNVSHLVVLYSINVFITFVLSQAGMVRHWWQLRNSEFKKCRRKLVINGVGLGLTSFILVSVVFIKFEEGAWVTFLVTSVLILASLLIRRHYTKVAIQLKQLDHIVEEVEQNGLPLSIKRVKENKSKLPTAVITVSGYNGLGVNSILSILSTYGDYFKNFVFVEIGVVNASIFKQEDEFKAIEQRISDDMRCYIRLMEKHGFTAQGMSAIGTDVVDEMMELTPAILLDHPQSVFFGSQLIFESDNIFNKLLHNYQVVSLQRRLFRSGLQFVMLPVDIPNLSQPTAAKL